MAAPRRAVVTAVAAATLAASAVLEPWVAAVVIAALCCVFAFGWPRLAGAPSKRGSSIVIGLAGIGAVAVALFIGTPTHLAGVVAAGIIGGFVHQMMRQDGRPRLVESVSATATGVIAVVSAAGWILAETVDGGTATILVCAAVLVSTAAVTAFRLRGGVAAAVSALVGAAVGVGVGALLPAVGLLSGSLIGFIGGGFIACSHLVLNHFPASSHRRAAIAAALLPVLVVGIPIHLVAALGS